MLQIGWEWRQAAAGSAADRQQTSVFPDTPKVGKLTHLLFLEWAGEILGIFPLEHQRRTTFHLTSGSVSNFSQQQDYSCPQFVLDESQQTSSGKFFKEDERLQQDRRWREHGGFVQAWWRAFRIWGPALWPLSSPCRSQHEETGPSKLFKFLSQLSELIRASETTPRMRKFLGILEFFCLWIAAQAQMKIPPET